MDEDLPASCGPTAASMWSGGPSQALAGPLRVPIQLWVPGLETHSHKILTWQRGFEPPDFDSALQSGEDQDRDSSSSSPARAAGPILPGK